MTFEEFLIKKKIDLAQLKAAEPVLASEFESHYRQMGEKSFDHSKKFLFNKLRRTYRIKEEPKPAVAKEVIKVNELASQAEPLLSPSLEATVYTPRFKPAGIKTPPKPETSADNPVKETKPVFKPRFKPGLAKTELEERHAGEPAEELKAEMPNPVYKPRFKSVSIPSTEIEPETAKSVPSESKPGFKPRFKPGITNAPPTESIPEPKNESLDEKPKPAYIPRFKLGVTDSPAEEPASESKLNSIEGAPKPAYKPRFKAATTKPQDGTSGQEK